MLVQGKLFLFDWKKNGERQTERSESLSSLFFQFLLIRKIIYPRSCRQSRKGHYPENFLSRFRKWDFSKSQSWRSGMENGAQNAVDDNQIHGYEDLSLIELSQKNRIDLELLNP